MSENNFKEIMESSECGSALDFGFAFNDLKFSDRTLQIIIIPDPLDSEPIHTLKRPRVDQLQDSTGHEVVRSNGKSSASSAGQIKTIHISTPILSAKSQFFLKLFSNGMVESKEQLVTMRIQESEEAAFMDMLKFMYTNTLSSTTPSALLDVLMAADKYQVALCMRYCSQLLRNLPMTCESALLYLDLPSTMLVAVEFVQPLVDAAKEFLVSSFKDISKCQDEMLNLPLAAIEVVLSSDHLQVASEDEIYDFVMKWAGRHYTNSLERQGMITEYLPRLVRLKFLSFKKIVELLTCTDIDIICAPAIFFAALAVESPYRQLIVTKEQERAYEVRPVKIITFDSPHKECIVYLDLKREECTRLLPSGHIRSRNFLFGGQIFGLFVGCGMNSQMSVPCFGFLLAMRENKSLERFVVEYEISLRTKPSAEFVLLKKAENNFAQWTTDRNISGFAVPWDTIIAENSPYIINGVLHIKAVLKLKEEV